MWTAVIIGIALGARYQYTTDIFLTIIIVPFIVTHPITKFLGEKCFIKSMNRHRDVMNDEETVSLMNNNIHPEKEDI